MRFIFQKVYVLAVILIGFLVLNACDNTWEGCPDGYYPDGGECVAGCPFGTYSNKDGKCMPSSAQSSDGDFFVDGDDAAVDGDDVDAVVDGDKSENDVVDGDITDGDKVETDAVESDISIIAPGLTWISIPSGSYQMGCVPQDNDCDTDESPRHSVNVSTFEMTQTEVTNAQYVGFLSDHGNACDGNKCVDEYYSDIRLSESGGVWSVDSGYETHPLVTVTWYGAKAFCEAVGGRLPSEAEWEYAARAGTATIYPCGDNSNCLNDIAWYEDYTPGDYGHPVGEKNPNAFGLYDMIGNVREWIEDCWHDNYDEHPGTGEVWTGGDCSYHMVRGDSWGTPEALVQVYGSDRENPWDEKHDLGFRCVRD